MNPENIMLNGKNWTQENITTLSTMYNSSKILKIVESESVMAGGRCWKEEKMRSYYSKDTNFTLCKTNKS